MQQLLLSTALMIAIDRNYHIQSQEIKENVAIYALITILIEEKFRCFILKYYHERLFLTEESIIQINFCFLVFIGPFAMKGKQKITRKSYSSVVGRLLTP